MPSQFGWHSLLDAKPFACDPRCRQPAHSRKLVTIKINTVFLILMRFAPSSALTFSRLSAVNHTVELCRQEWRCKAQERRLTVRAQQNAVACCRLDRSGSHLSTTRPPACSCLPSRSIRSPSVPFCHTGLKVCLALIFQSGLALTVSCVLP